MDRALGSERWRLCFPEASVFHLPHVLSDHNPILIDLNCQHNRPFTKPFCFEAMWTTHAEFEPLVRQSWNTQRPFGESLVQFTAAVKHWNSEVFGNVFRNKRRLLARIAGIQRQPDYHVNWFLQNLEKNLQGEYTWVLNHEEIFWFQKSRAQWMSLGDRNTRFYHLSTVVRRKRNKIESLRLESGDWCTDSASLRTHARDYFMNLFGPLESARVPLPPEFARGSVLTPEDSQLLVQPVQFSETSKAIGSMGACKAPGPDGFNPLFF